MAEVLVRYFAGAAAAAGVDEEQVDVEPTTTLAELGTELVRRHPGLEAVLAVSSLLVDEVPAADRSLRLGSAAQVDVLPPFAGG